MRDGVRLRLIFGLVLLLTPQAAFGQYQSTFGGNESSDPVPQAARKSSASQEQSASSVRPALPIPTAAYATDSYRLGSRDVMDVTVYGVPELSVTAKVGDDGNIQLPLLGSTRAAGKTAEQLQREITSRLGADYLQDPQVTVLVTEFNSRSVIVTGALKNGVYPLKGETTLLELVAGAGGFKQNSDSTVVILRQSGGKRTAAKFDVSKIEKGLAPDVTLKPGDRILASESAIKKAYGVGMKALGLAGRFAIF
jgi:polysaccharide export outer membrane protein